MNITANIANTHLDGAVSPLTSLPHPPERRQAVLHHHTLVHTPRQRPLEVCQPSSHSHHVLHVGPQHQRAVTTQHRHHRTVGVAALDGVERVRRRAEDVSRLDHRLRLSEPVEVLVGEVDVEAGADTTLSRLRLLLGLLTRLTLRPVLHLTTAITARLLLIAGEDVGVVELHHHHIAVVVAIDVGVDVADGAGEVVAALVALPGRSVLPLLGSTLVGVDLQTPLDVWSQ